MTPRSPEPQGAAEDPLPRRGTVPTRHQLAAAVRAASVLSPAGTRLEDARDSYLALPTGGLYRSPDLILGERLLIRLQLVRRQGTALCPGPEAQMLPRLPEPEAVELLLGLLLERQPPIWLSGVGDDDEPALEYIPQDAGALLEQVVGAAPSQAAFLRGIASKVDPERNAETGALAEQHVAERCRAELTDHGREDLAGEVHRISLVNDTAGYDVAAPRLDSSARHLEVKGSRGKGSTLTVYVSPNEVARGIADRDWALVLCQVADSDQVEVWGWIAAPRFADRLPSNRSGNARWESASLRLTRNELTPGLPSCDPQPSGA